MGCKGDLVDGTLAFYSDDPSSNPAEAQVQFKCMFNVVKMSENKYKEAEVDPFKNNNQPCANTHNPTQH